LKAAPLQALLWALLIYSFTGTLYAATWQAQLIRPKTIISDIEWTDLSPPIYMLEKHPTQPVLTVLKGTVRSDLRVSWKSKVFRKLNANDLSFSTYVRIKGPVSHFEITATDNAGKTYTEKLTIRFPEWDKLQRVIARKAAQQKPAAFQADTSLSAELGHQLAQMFDPTKLTRNRLYGLAKGSLKLTKGDDTTSSLTLNAALRGWLDRENELSIRALNVSWAHDHWALHFGFQEIAWGEAFGFYILDLVNPRDWRDPLFNELSWVRLPVFAANLQFFFDRVTAQLILTPVARHGQFPKRSSPFDQLPQAVPTIQEPNSLSLSNFPKDAEFGGRLGYLFEFGLDLSFYYYNHFNRIPTYELIVSPLGDLSLSPVFQKVQTFGSSFTHTLGDFVLRGDQILQTGLATSPKWQSVLGSDVVTQNDWTLGAQYHADLWEGSKFHSMSVRILKKLANGKLEPELFIYHGLNNNDQWIQPKLTWNTTSALAISLRADFLPGKGPGLDGQLFGLKDKSRFLTWVSYKF
jgi:hypothetical protein